MDSDSSLTKLPIKVRFHLVFGNPTPCLSLAAAAMHAMNGAVIGSKAIVVRLHEPKQLRQEKLARQFGSNGHPRSVSGSTSPTASEMGDMYSGGWSPRSRATSLMSSPTMVGTPMLNQQLMNDRPERVRRGSGSYYQVRLPMCSTFCCVHQRPGGSCGHAQCADAVRRPRGAFPSRAKRHPDG